MKAYNPEQGRLMAEGEWVIQEVRMAGSSLIVRIPAARNIQPVAGQYFQAYAPGFNEPAASPLFLAGNLHDTWDLTGGIQPNWNPGVRIKWRGPLGCGFEPPVSAKKIAFIPWRDSGLTLLPVLLQALKQEAAVVWYGHQVPDWLPTAVEVLSSDLLPEAGNWADYIALTCEMAQLGDVLTSMNLMSPAAIKCRAEVLIQTSMVCGGTGNCGVCSVKTRHGWKLACKDGPVFDFQQLED